MARSYLNLNSFSKSAKAYRRADKAGYRLLDHDKNHFKAEILDGNLTSSFKISLKEKRKSEREKMTSQIVRELKRVSDARRVEIIEEMSEISTLPKSIADLLPWSPRKIDFDSEIDDSYTALSDQVVQVDRFRREISRIRGSATYQLSRLITKSIRNPIKFISLPISFPMLLVKIYREKKGFSGNSAEPLYPIWGNFKSRDCIVFFPTNGVGFGHFTRLLAIARDFRKKHTDTEIVFFTTMPTLHILSNDNFVCYHLPGRYKYEEMDPSTWNSICEEMLTLVFSLHRPKAFVFDGAYPYRGMLNAIQSYPDGMLKAWLRRGAIKKGAKGIPVDSLNHFHAIIRPGDSVETDLKEEFQTGTPLVRTNPILLLNREDMLPRGSLRKRMGIPEEAVLCYLQLGAGQINDIESEIRKTLKSLSQHEEVYTILGESLIGEEEEITGKRIRVLRDYPNSRYFKDFDFAIMASGYNSFHEAVEARLPTIFFPNMKTGRDDQLARAVAAAELGAMVVLKNRDEKNIRLAIERIVDSETRDLMRHRCEKLVRENGASQVTEWINNQISS